MEIGTDDIDFSREELYEEESIDSPIEQEDELVQDEPSNESEEDLIPMILKSRGIDDLSKIKFENESGGIDEIYQTPLLINLRKVQMIRRFSCLILLDKVS